MKLKKIIVILIGVLLICLGIHANVLAKYELIETKTIAYLDLDRTAPIGKVTYSTQKATKENVIVTIEFNEKIQPIMGWKEVKENVWQKEYEENTNEKVVLQDICGNQTELPIHINNIDREGPTIKIEEISNSNKEYPQYANKQATIKIRLKIEDENKIQELLAKEKIKIYVQEERVRASQIKIEEKEKAQEVEIIIEKVQEEGLLSIQIEEGSIVDELGNKNEDYCWNSDILFDNTTPVIKVEQKIIEQGKVEVIIQVNEAIRKLEGWNKKENQYSKIFENNISYELPIIDLAGNSTKAKIEIKNATSIILSYASHNSEIGWTFGYGNYDIAGIEAIENKRELRTEALAFRIEGNVEPDFLQARAYVHTYWGEGSEAICQDTKKKYIHGFNPSATTWKSMNTKEGLAHLADNKDYFILGGAGVNLRGLADAQGKNPIPDEIAVQHLYGVSGISFKLKDTSVYSIIYQIYIEEIGWLAPCKNEEFACYRKDKPISGLRIALVPNSEMEYIWNEWEKETGEKIQ